MEILPIEVKINILSYLSPFDLSQVALLNSTWYSLTRDQELWCKLDVNTIPNVCDGVLNRIVARFPRMTHLVAAAPSSGDNLNVTEECITNLCLQAAQSLRYIDFKRNSTIDDDVLSIIASWCTNLRHLDLSMKINVNDRILELLNQSLSINSLSLSRCDAVTDRGLGIFLEDRSMTYLNTAGILGVKYQSILNLTLYSSKTLVKLILDGGNLTNRDLELLSELKRLQYLEIQYCDQFTDEGYRSLRLLPDLLHLKLSRAFEFTDSSLSEIVESVRLRSLSLVDAVCIGNEGLVVLSLFGVHLQKLEISSSYGNTITDMGLGCILMRCHQLQELLLRGIRGAMNFVVLIPICASSYLKYVNLGGCQNIPDDTIKTIARLCPQITIRGRFAVVIKPDD